MSIHSVLRLSLTTPSGDFDETTFGDLQRLCSDLRDSESMVSAQAKKTVSCFEGFLVKNEANVSLLFEETRELRDQLTKALGQLREFQILHQTEAKASKEKEDSLEKTIDNMRKDILESQRITDERLQKGDKDLAAALGDVKKMESLNQDLRQTNLKLENQLSSQAQANSVALSSLTEENNRTSLALKNEITEKSKTINQVQGTLHEEQLQNVRNTGEIQRLTQASNEAKAEIQRLSNAYNQAQAEIKRLTTSPPRQVPWFFKKH